MPDTDKKKTDAAPLPVHRRKRNDPKPGAAAPATARVDPPPRRGGARTMQDVEAADARAKQDAKDAAGNKNAAQERKKEAKKKAAAES